MLKPIMVLLWMILLVVLLCAEAENIKAKGELGTNVTLTCSNRSSDTHWYMEIHSQLRGCIGRSFSLTVSTYCSPDFEAKFSISGNRLIIKNFTAEDCRLYFCGRKRNGSIHFMETFYLVSNATLSDNNNPQNNCIPSQFFIIIISVFVATVIILIMGGLFILLCLRKKNSSTQLDDPSIHIYENSITL